MTADKGNLFHRNLQQGYPVIVRGEGIYLYDQEGRRYIDGIAGAGNVTLGHGRKRIAAAMAEQAETLAYCFSAFFTNQPALDLAPRIAALAPGDLNSCYFVSGGSEAIETAFKLARQYHLQKGNSQKHKVISRWRGYHGATLGAMAASGLPAQRNPFAPLLPDFPHIAACHPYRCALAGCEGVCNLMCARQLEETILQEGPETVSAFVAEPVVMAGAAVAVPPDGYFAEIREICDRYEVLFIADEIITGFGRTGRVFAMDHWGVVPDIIAFGKAASSGYIPLGGLVISDEIRQVFFDGGESFAHVFTYVNNPVAMRVCGTVLDIIAEEGIIEHVVEMGEYLAEKAEGFKQYACVGDVRSKGLMMGIELVRDKQTKAPFAAQEGMAARGTSLALQRGLHIAGVPGVADWVRGDDLRFYPPLVITREQIDEAVGIIDEVLDELTREAGL